MSTSCIISFTDGVKTVTTYKHSDGYASHVVPMLEKFIKWNIRQDLEYCIANWFYFAKREDRIHSEKLSKDLDLDMKYQDVYDQIGYGLELEEYEPDFVVNVKDKTVVTKDLYKGQYINLGRNNK